MINTAYKIDEQLIL